MKYLNQFSLSLLLVVVLTVENLLSFKITIDISTLIGVVSFGFSIWSVIDNKNTQKELKKQHIRTLINRIVECSAGIYNCIVSLCLVANPNYKWNNATLKYLSEQLTASMHELMENDMSKYSIMLEAIERFEQTVLVCKNNPSYQAGVDVLNANHAISTIRDKMLDSDN